MLSLDAIDDFRRSVYSILNAPIDAGTLLLLIVLYLLGERLADGNTKLQLVGKRIALAAFFQFVFLLAYDSKPSTADELVTILLRSLIFAGIVLGAAWTILPTSASIYSHTIEPVRQAFNDWKQGIRRKSEERKVEWDRQRAEAEWERDRPEREREAASRIGDQKRRDDAKAACDALFMLAAPEIGVRFSKQDYAEFVSKYMTNTAPPEVVEERAEQLKAIIQQHQERVEPLPKRKSLQEASAWFEERMSEIQSVPDERLRKTLVAQLKERYSELTSAMLSEMTP
jgi:hypothetical protein